MLLTFFFLLDCADAGKVYSYCGDMMVEIGGVSEGCGLILIMVVLIMRVEVITMMRGGEEVAVAE